VLEYLGRYTHRVAISNHRLVACTEETVQFRWKDYADHDRVKVMTLTVGEFLRRFLLHIVPARFMRIRHFGLLANRHRVAMLAHCRQLLNAPVPTLAAAAGTRVDVLVAALRRCPVCHVGSWVIIEILPPGRAPLPPDSS
jgi:hypothetical protein